MSETFQFFYPKTHAQSWPTSSWWTDPAVQASREQFNRVVEQRQLVMNSAPPPRAKSDPQQPKTDTWKAKSKAWLADGKCRDCGGPLAATSSRFCQPHLERHRTYCAASRERKTA